MCRACRLPEAAESLVDGGHRGVGLVEGGEGLLGVLLSGDLFGKRSRQRRGQFLGTPFGVRQIAHRVVDRGLNLESAGLPVRTATDPPGTEQVSVSGDGAQFRCRVDNLDGVVDRVDHHYTGEEREQACSELCRALDDVGRPTSAEGERGTGRGNPVTSDHQSGPSAVGIFQRADSCAGRIE